MGLYHLAIIDLKDRKYIVHRPSPNVPIERMTLEQGFDVYIKKPDVYTIVGLRKLTITK